MSKKAQQKSVVRKVASKRVMDQNTIAFKAYDAYRKAADIIECAEFASGKRVIFKSDTASTFNSPI